MIFNDKGEALMHRRGPKAKNELGCWQIPDGAVDFGETRAQAIVREVKEEIGVDVIVEHELLTTDHLIPDEGQHWVTTPFVVRVKEGQSPKILEPQKHEALGWFTLDKLPSPVAITTKHTLRSYQYHLKHGG